MFKETGYEPQSKLLCYPPTIIVLYMLCCYEPQSMLPPTIIVLYMLCCCPVAIVTMFALDLSISNVYSDFIIIVDFARLDMVGL